MAYDQGALEAGRVHARASALPRVLALVLGVACAGFVLGLALSRVARPLAARPAPPPPVGARAPDARALPPLPVRWLGAAGDSDARLRAALERVLATGIGVRARQLLASGALPGPLTIVLNHEGDHFTRYRIPGRELGETIVFDPDSLPLVETEEGPRPALLETVLAHELGHAVFKLVDEDAVIRAIENPVRDDLGLPRRVRF